MTVPPIPENPYPMWEGGDEPTGYRDMRHRAWDEGFAAGRAAASPDPPDAADLVAAHLRERWPCTCRPGMDGGGVYHAADCNSRREGSQAVLAVIRLLRAANPPASPDERLREALRVMIDVFDRHDRWCGHYADAPGDGIIHKVPAARAALAADRDKPEGVA